MLTRGHERTGLANVQVQASYAVKARREGECRWSRIDRRCCGRRGSVLRHGRYYRLSHVKQLRCAVGRCWHRHNGRRYRHLEIVTHGPGRVATLTGDDGRHITATVVGSR